jgi:hypothetical protein
MSIEQMREAYKHLQAAQRIWSAGPLESWVKKLMEHSEALLTKFAPIKAGEHAMICKKVPCALGWAGCEDTLRVGATGVIQEVDYYGGRFVYQFQPDRETWWNQYTQAYEPVRHVHTFSLSDKYLVRCLFEPGEEPHEACSDQH